MFFFLFKSTTINFVVGNGLNYGGYDNVPLPLDKTVHIILGIISQGKITFHVCRVLHLLYNGTISLFQMEVLLGNDILLTN